jgi:hypothetical protein
MWYNNCWLLVRENTCNRILQIISQAGPAIRRGIEQKRKSMITPTKEILAYDI